MASESRKKPIVKSMRVSPEQYEEIKRIAKELNVSDATLMRVGTIMIMKAIEDDSIDWLEFYKYASTT